MERNVLPHFNFKCTLYEGVFEKLRENWVNVYLGHSLAFKMKFIRNNYSSQIHIPLGAFAYSDRGGFSWNLCLPRIKETKREWKESNYYSLMITDECRRIFFYSKLFLRCSMSHVQITSIKSSFEHHATLLINCLMESLITGPVLRVMFV